MSKPRYKWWGYIKAVIRSYPDHINDLNEIRSPTLTPNYGKSEGHGYEVPRTTEQLALKRLPEEDMKEFEAVDRAIAYTINNYQDADIRIKLIKLVFFSRSHTLQGAALECNISYSTSKIMHNAFIKQVAREFGILK